jgi:Baseplate J-like protein
MATIVYLDAEDEITSAASRIRGAAEKRVGLVLPFNSRVSTSRINFRLLAREAMDNGRRLDIIAPDASARALAASAGLPVFGSVGEYEDALEQGGAALEAMTAATAGGTATGVTHTGAARTGAARTGAARTGAARTDAARTDAARRTADPDAARPAPDGRDAGPTTRERAGGEPHVVRGRRRLPGRAAVLAVVMVVIAGGAVAAAGYLLLPSAVITITPRIEAVGPISFTVRADPDVTAVDSAEGVVPARTLAIPIEAEGEFPASDKRVERTPATGGVRWTNCDVTAAYTIPSGTVVKTSDGTGFTTDEQVFLPVASLSGTPPNVKVKCQTSEVSVTAVDPGPAGNVDARAIDVVPARYNRIVISVGNASATSGGRRDVFMRIGQADVDAAIEQLTKDIDAQFATELENPSRVPPGMTAFPDTAVLGDPVPSVDPSTLVGQEVDSFTLRMTAQGTVLAVDPAPVTTIARERLSSQVTSGYQLVDGSTSVEVGAGSVVAGVVTFPVTGSARQLRPVDAAALERAVLGLPEAEARARLEPYGDVSIELWPDWVDAVPSLDQRVTVTVTAPIDIAPSPSPTTETPSLGPSGGAGESQPVPSGG